VQEIFRKGQTTNYRYDNKRRLGNQAAFFIWINRRMKRLRQKEVLERLHDVIKMKNADG